MGLQPGIKVSPSAGEPEPFANGIEQQQHHEQGADDAQQVSHGAALPHHWVKGVAYFFGDGGEVIGPAVEEQAGEENQKQGIRKS